MNLNLIQELFISKKIVLLILIVFSFASCKKCQDCTCTVEGVSNTQEVCKEDMSTAEYNAAIAVIENNEEVDCDCN